VGEVSVLGRETISMAPEDAQHLCELCCYYRKIDRSDFLKHL
jgi:hypothetical protein